MQHAQKPCNVLILSLIHIFYDFICTDYNLPDDTGTALLQHEFTKNIPICIMTTSVDRHIFNMAKSCLLYTSLASTSFGVYKNFTAIDTHTVHEKEIIQLRSVSYTHLDVYKRQAVTSDKKCHSFFVKGVSHGMMQSGYRILQTDVCSTV